MLFITAARLSAVLGHAWAALKIARLEEKKNS